MFMNYDVSDVFTIDNMCLLIGYRTWCAGLVACDVWGTSDVKGRRTTCDEIGTSECNGLNNKTKLKYYVNINSLNT